MENRRNYYRILHVQRDAPLEVIRMSYRTLMQRLKMHPDLGGDHWNASLINEAWAVLSDPEQRAAYDRTLLPAAEESEAFARSRTQPAAGQSADPDTGGEPGNERPAGRRTIDRMPRSMPVMVWPSPTERGALSGSTIDVSPQGMRVASNTRLPVGEVVSIECDLCSAVARVRSCAPGDETGMFALGLEFLEMQPKARRGGFVSARV